MASEFPSSSSTPPARIGSAREDCWSEAATFTLIEAWGRCYVELNRGNLRQKQWQDVADSVNIRHGRVTKSRRTDVQCKNRIDTLKKKFKSEKKEVLISNGSYTSSWPFFDPLDDLIGSTVSLTDLSPMPPPPVAVPIRGGGVKRPIAAPADFRRNYSAIAAAAAAESDDEDDDDVERDDDDDVDEGGSVEGIRKLARVIEKFGEVYAKVEGEKQKQMIELEKQRMQFAKELECQRMQMLVEMQVQLDKIKRAKRSDDSNDVSPFFLQTCTASFFFGAS